MTTIEGDTLILRPRFNAPIDEKLMKMILKCKKIKFNDLFNQFLPQLPDCITHITFGSNFNKPIGIKEDDKDYGLMETQNCLPRNLVFLKFGKFFNQRVDNLPPTITHLIFGEYFEQPVDHLPVSLKYLKFGESFKEKVDHLPPNVKLLKFGDFFNQSLSNIPPSVEVIYTGFNYSQPLIGLPEGLKFITIGNNYRHSIQELPDSVEVIALGYFKGEELEGKRQVIRKYYWCLVKCEIIKKLPKNLKYLYMNENYDNFDQIVEDFKNVDVNCEQEILISDIYERIGFVKP